MRSKTFSFVAAGLIAAGTAALAAQQTGQQAGAPGAPAAQAGAPARTATGNGIRPDDDIKKMVARLELDKFKATLKDLTQFGDRREGSQRNRNAVDWIEAKLKSYGCADVTRITYEIAARGAGGGNRGAAATGARCGAAGAGATGATGAGAAGAVRARRGRPAHSGVVGLRFQKASRGQNRVAASALGSMQPTGVNVDPMLQPDEKIRALYSIWSR